MYFSYFARAQNHPDIKSGELAMVSIALYSPQWLPGLEKDLRLAPNRGDFDEYRAHIIGIEEFSQRYIAKVKGCVSAERILKLYEDSVLCCYETPDKFCHRLALQAWLKMETGVMVPELAESKPTHKQLDLFGGGTGE